MQAAHPTANGTTTPKAAQKAYAKAKAYSQLSPELLLMIERDPNQAVGIAVNQVHHLHISCANNHANLHACQTNVLRHQAYCVIVLHGAT
jgi:hypothetical protein